MNREPLLVINCQQALSYDNRGVLTSLYGDRFPSMLFTVGGTCPIDPAYPTLATDWTPRLRDNVCACCDPSRDPHPAGRHATHPRLARVAEYARDRGHDLVVFVEDDCLLGPGVDDGSIRQRMEGRDALIPYVAYCDRDSARWVWTNHATGYPAFDVSARGFDRERMRRHYAAFSGEPAPPVLFTPMFGCFADMLVFRTELLAAMAPDLIALQDVWHEAAIPSALMHRTSRVDRLNGVALWGDGRERTRDELFGMLNVRDYVHPIKLSHYSASEARDAYAAALRGGGRDPTGRGARATSS